MVCETTGEGLAAEESSASLYGVQPCTDKEEEGESAEA